jgi:hypothetical protein
MRRGRPEVAAERPRLSVRRAWRCEGWGAGHDRDHAAAQVILLGAAPAGSREPAAMPRKRGLAVSHGHRASARCGGGPPANVALPVPKAIAFEVKQQFRRFPLSDRPAAPSHRSPSPPLPVHAAEYASSEPCVVGRCQPKPKLPRVDRPLPQPPLPPDLGLAPDRCRPPPGHVEPRAPIDLGDRRPPGCPHRGSELRWKRVRHQMAIAARLEDPGHATIAKVVAIRRAIAGELQHLNRPAIVQMPVRPVPERRHTAPSQLRHDDHHQSQPVTVPPPILATPPAHQLVQPRHARQDSAAASSVARTVKRPTALLGDHTLNQRLLAGSPQRLRRGWMTPTQVGPRSRTPAPLLQVMTAAHHPTGLCQ